MQRRSFLAAMGLGLLSPKLMVPKVTPPDISPTVVDPPKVKSFISLEGQPEPWPFAKRLRLVNHQNSVVLTGWPMGTYYFYRDGSPYGKLGKELKVRKLDSKFYLRWIPDNGPMQIFYPGTDGYIFINNNRDNLRGRVIPGIDYLLWTKNSQFKLFTGDYRFNSQYAGIGAAKQRLGSRIISNKRYEYATPRLMGTA